MITCRTTPTLWTNVYQSFFAPALIICERRPRWTKGNCSVQKEDFFSIKGRLQLVLRDENFCWHGPL
jgi:hypothetical protein